MKYLVYVWLAAMLAFLGFNVVRFGHVYANGIRVETTIAVLDKHSADFKTCVESKSRDEMISIYQAQWCAGNADLYILSELSETIK